jgi:hypothetical protein
MKIVPFYENRAATIGPVNMAPEVVKIIEAVLAGTKL